MYLFYGLDFFVKDGRVNYLKRKEVSTLIRTKFLEAVLEKMPFLAEVGDEDAFFRRISTHIPPLDPGYIMIQKAYSDITAAYEGQKRETGEDFVTHGVASALIQFEYQGIRNPNRISANLLHDIIEHGKWTIEKIQAEYGYEHAWLLSFLSKPTNQDFPGLSKEQLLQIFHNRSGIAPREYWEIRCSDVFHNLTTMWKSSQEKIERKVEEAKRYYLPYAEKYQIMFHEIEAAVESLEEELKLLKQKAP